MPGTDWHGVAQRVGQWLRDSPARAGTTRVVAVDGRSGSGKTTLAARLHEELNAPVVSMEDLYGGWDGLDHGISLLAREVLRPLSTGRAAFIPRYDWATQSWAEPRVLQPPGFLIVEGVGSGARLAASYESLVAWIEAPSGVRKQRALARDGELFEQMWERWAAQEDRMLARDQTPGRAHVIIDAAAGTVTRPGR